MESIITGKIFKQKAKGMQFIRLKNFAKQTNLHGLRYVADEEKSCAVRIFWAIFFGVNCGFMLVLFNDAYQSFQENAVSFVTETTYLDWNTTFPAITICPNGGSTIEWDQNEMSLEDFEITKQFIIDLVYFTGSCYSCVSDCTLCQKINFTKQVEKYRMKCSDLFTQCKWNEEALDCCEKFVPLETEYGICYSFNSLHTGAPDKYQMNRKTGIGELQLKVKEDIRIYLHAPEDVPFINSDPELRKEVLLGESFNMSVNVIEISNDENVKHVPIRKRGCRFPWEAEGLTVHKYYSYSTCVVQCHAENHIRLCNCTHHLMPYYNKINFCNLNGLQCLTDNFDILNRIQDKSSQKPGINCECLPSCVEPEYTIVADTKEDKSHLSEISIKIHSLPTSRFKRIVLRTSLDLVVSLGGAASLFIGASLISIIEAIYLFWSGGSQQRL